MTGHARRLGLEFPRGGDICRRPEGTPHPGTGLQPLTHPQGGVTAPYGFSGVPGLRQPGHCSGWRHPGGRMGRRLQPPTPCPPRQPARHPDERGSASGGKTPIRRPTSEELQSPTVGFYTAPRARARNTSEWLRGQDTRPRPGSRDANLAAFTACYRTCVEHTSEHPVYVCAYVHGILACVLDACAIACCKCS